MEEIEKEVSQSVDKEGIKMGPGVLVYMQLLVAVFSWVCFC